MIKDLDLYEQEVLGRILMKKIVALLDERDFGRTEDPQMRYAHPHLGTPASALLVKFIAKLSPERQKWYNDNAELILVAKTDEIKETELPYYQSKVAQLKKANGGHVLKHGSTKAKSIDQTATSNQAVQPKK